MAGALMNSEDNISVTFTNEDETGKSCAVTVVAFSAFRTRSRQKSRQF